MRKTGLIITPFAPLVPGQSVTGVFRRLRMFASALHKVVDDVKLLGIVPAHEVEAYRDTRAIEEGLEAQWGFPASVALSATRNRPQTTWNHYVPGVFSINEQPEFYHYGGAAQAEAVRQAFEAQPDLVLVHRLAAMIPVLRAGVRHDRVFFDLDDIEHKVRIRRAMLPPRSPGALACLSHVPALAIAERRAVALARNTFVCSEQDRHYLGRLGFGRKISVILNAVDIPAPGSRPFPEPVALFLGDLRYPPNRAGAERMIHRIWPRVLAQRPDARLIVAGPGPELLSGFVHPPPGVELTGFVESLPALYGRARIVVCPLDTGGGTRVKLIEAAAYSKPIVSTTVGAENLGFVPGEDILLRDADAAFAEACDMLLGDDALCSSLGMAVHGKVARLYARPNVERQIVELFRAGAPGTLPAMIGGPAQALTGPLE